ncbi:MAG: FAD-dependent oxidoreductase [Rubrivivax sp.]|nr:FAD-dependent oxidoreductase [Rubrivivax sp.]
MLKTYTWPRFAYRPAPQPQPAVPLVVVGAGPVGLCAAIDAALRGQPVVLLDEDDTVSIGSRGVCYAKRTLEILDRLGVGDAVVAKGITWNVGRTFHRDREVFAFDLQPEPGHRRPGMVNLQQYHLEEILVKRAAGLPLIDLRWKHRVTQVQPDADGVTLQVDTPDGPYMLRCDWLVVADGAKSPIRRQLGLDIEGKVFQDRFLIADVLLDGEPFAADRTERRFWFEPRFHGGQSALMHRQADKVWRLDFQLGWDADPEAEKQPERVAPRVRAALDGQGMAQLGFELEWCSVYTFQCRRMQRFRHDRLVFVGDAAHQVSPFGARGANSGIQDTDNLMWKLDLVLRGLAPQALLDSYDAERGYAADENLLNSTRSTDFMTPKTRASRVLRDAVLSLAAEQPFARGLVNSGRLSVPATLVQSPLNTPDEEPWDGWMLPGAPADDALLPGHGGPDGWLLERLPPQFVLLLFSDVAAPGPEAPVPVLRLPATGLAAQRFGAREGSCVLLRPDQHVAARWRAFDIDKLRAALARATAQEVRP